MKQSCFFLQIPIIDCGIILFCLVFLGMESEGNSQNFKQGKKGTRRSWSKFEEDAFFTVLDEFVDAGQRCETGSFKSGTMVQIEKALILNVLIRG